MMIDSILEDQGRSRENPFTQMLKFELDPSLFQQLLSLKDSTEMMKPEEEQSRDFSLKYIKTIVSVHYENKKRKRKESAKSNKRTNK